MTMIYKLEKSNREILSQLYHNNSSPNVLTYLQGYAGEAYVDNPENPTIAVILVSIFATIAGNPQAPAAESLLKSIPDKRLVIAHSDEWHKKIEEVLSTSITKHQRYRCSGKLRNFTVAALQKYADRVPEGYVLKRIDNKLISDNSLVGLPRDFSENFDSAEEFVEKGVGFWILHEGAVVSGATSLSVYNGGIEVDIETHEDHRGKGLARAVAAKLILYCIQHTLSPYWEAANPTSLKMAIKLGYSYEGSYDCYWIWRGD